MTDRLAPLSLPDLTGRSALVTGGSGGTGAAVAAALAAAGADVTITSRDNIRASTAANRLRGVALGRVSAHTLDTADPGSVDQLAAQWGDRPLDMLVLNAGSAAPPTRVENEAGHESTMATNALGHVRLTHHLLGPLRAASGRVVTVGSLAALTADGDAGDLCLAESWTHRQAYARSKLACIVFALELPARAGVAAMPAHPGWAVTSFFGVRVPARALLGWGRTVRLAQSAADGAQPLVAAAVGLPDVGGSTGYVGPAKGVVGPPGPASLPRPARDASVRAAWWAALCEHAGVPQDWR